MKALALQAGFAALCSAADMSGHYVLRGVMEVGSEMLLRPDGTFAYMLAYGAADYHARGRWKQEGNAVVLTSDVRELPPFRLVRAEVSNEDAFKVIVKAPNGRPVPNIDVLLKTDTEDVKERTDQQGVAVFLRSLKVQNIRFHIRVYDFESDSFPVEASKNEYQFEINGEAITQVKFKDERLEIDDKCLKMLFWRSDKPMRYCRGE